MTESIYWVILLIIDSILMFMGLHLILGTITKRLQGTSYHAARRSAGVALTITPLSGFIYYFINASYNELTYIATAVNLTAYYVMATMLVISFMYIVDHRSGDLHQIFVVMGCSFLVYLIPVWVPIIIGRIDLVDTCHIIANIMLVGCCIAILTYAQIIYKTALKKSENYYSEDMKAHVHWVSDSILLFVGLAVIACISPFSNNYSLWLCLFYLIYETGVYMYIYSSVKRFEFSALSILASYENVERVEQLDVEPQVKGMTINEEAYQNITKGLDKWVQEEGYNAQGLTVKSVASQICTNRTYLSIYINQTYKCSFKVWVTQLRIDEAKKLLLDNEEYSAGQIALKIGFASAGSFIHTFRKIEGTSPMVWRVKHKKSK